MNMPHVDDFEGAGIGGKQRMKSGKRKDQSTDNAQTAFPPGLAKPALRALEGAGYRHLEQLSTVSEAALLQLHGIGPNAIKSLHEALRKIGQSFAETDAKVSIAAPSNFSDLWSVDREKQNEAFHEIIALTSQPVDWANDVWNDVLANLTHQDNHNRAIAAQVLCNLAKSDNSNRMLHDFHTLFAVTGDERFVTARHCLQALWKVGTAGKEQRKLLLTALQKRFQDCVTHKNCTLIRYDIIKCMKELYDAVHDDGIRQVAHQLIESEDDLKYRKKYATLWRHVAAQD